MICVVILFFNEATAIADDLRIAAKAMPDYCEPSEIIVVDAGSADRSQQIVPQLTTVRLLEHPVNRARAQH